MSELLSIGYGLASAASWGSGDFSGGIASKRNHVYNVVIFSQIIGMVFLFILALLFLEPIPSSTNLLWGGIAGLAGALGLLALYKGLSTGQMSIIAPLSAIIAVTIPLVVSIIVEGPPAVLQFFGFGFALLAVWFISQSNNQIQLGLVEFKLILLAGLGFGFFFIFINQIQGNFVFWPLIVARIFSISLLVGISIFAKQFKVPDAKNLPVIALAGIFDVGGNAFFVLAAQTGRLDISAVLSSLYPAATVILAWLLLKERLSRVQFLGIVCAIVAIILITV